MLDFTGVKYQTSDQLKILSLSRIQRDHQDAQKNFWFLTERNPFEIHTVLINLSSGGVADEFTNVFQAQAIRELLIQGMAGTSAFDYKFRKKDMTITIKTNASVTIEKGMVEVDIQLFFQRLIVFTQPEEIDDAFLYELCSRPSSLFEK